QPPFPLELLHDRVDRRNSERSAAAARHGLRHVSVNDTWRRKRGVRLREDLDQSLFNVPIRDDRTGADNHDFDSRLASSAARVGHTDLAFTIQANPSLS